MLYDCSKITERLYIGSYVNSPEAVKDIQNLGITCVINGMETDNRYLYNDLDYIWNPTNDDGVHPKPPHWFGAAIDFGLAQIERPGTKILTHCAAGVNRGPSLGYAILRVLGWSKDDAFNIIRINRPQAQIAYREDAELALKHLGWIPK